MAAAAPVLTLDIPDIQVIVEFPADPGGFSGIIEYC